MNAALVKTDVAADILGRNARDIIPLVDGGTPRECGFMWAFNFSGDLKSRCRHLRFWRPELIARSQGEPAKYLNLNIGDVVAQILPKSRLNYPSGTVDQLLQLRASSRIKFGDELPGTLKGKTYFYSREALAAFLKRRWIGGAN